MILFYFTNIFHTFIGLYHLARECRQLQEPAKVNIQKNPQTLPPLDEFLLITPTRAMLEHQPEEASSTSVEVQQESPVLIDDQALVEFTAGQEKCEKFMQQDLTFYNLQLYILDQQEARNYLYHQMQ